MHKIDIGRHARWLRLAILAVVGLLAAVYLLARFGIRLPGVTIQSRSAPGAATPAWVGDVTLMLLATSLWPLQALLRKVESGDAFSVAMVRDFRAFAAWLLALSLFRVVVPTLFAQVQGSAGHGARVALMLDLRDLLLLMFTLILFLVARLLERARAAEESMAEIV